MAVTAITPCNLTAFRTGVEYTVTAATVDTANGTQEFDFDSNGKPFILIADVAASNGAVGLAFAKGDLWAAKAVSIGSAPQNKKTAFYVEPAYGAKNTGKVAIIATPASGKKLTTDHALKLSVVQL